MRKLLNTPHDEKIESAAEEFSRQGYKVIIEPSASEMPFNLGNYTPDLIAFKGDGGVLLEVKSRYAQVSVDQFRELAEKIAAHEGWRFRLVTLDDFSEMLLSGVEDNLPSWSEVNTKIDSIATLIQQAMVEPALLYLWSTIEAMLRKRAIAQNIPVDRFKPSQLLNHMYSSGEISVDEYDSLKSIFEKRNMLAHGLVTTLEPKDIEGPLSTIRSLLKSWRD